MSMLLSRRASIQSALAAFVASYVRLPGLFALPGSMPEVERRVSRVFGVRGGRLLDPASLYRVPAEPTAQDRLCFDVSNQQIACSVNAHGLLERVVIQYGVEPVETKATPVGAYVNKVLHRSGPWPLELQADSSTPQRLDRLPQPEIRLQDTLVPIYTWRIGTSTLNMTVFAPHVQDAAPSAICVGLALRASDGSRQSFRVMPCDSPEAPNVLTQSTGNWKLRTGEAPIASDGDLYLALAVAAQDEENTAALLAQMQRHSGAEWHSHTVAYHRSRYGELSIPEAPFFAELLTRSAELCRQSLMLDQEGQFGGSFNGSDLPPASNVWMRDCFYSTLPQALFAPELCAKAILFFLRWSVPSHPLGEHAAKFAGASGVTNSLGNSVAGIVLAERYYAATADHAFFKQHPEVLPRAQQILEKVLASRIEESFLFPSIYVSDGESRGDFHTGSNIFLWRAMSSFSRLAREIAGQPEMADIWATHAANLKQAILERCVVNDACGPRFVEGAMQDQTQISGHDGEESDVTLAAAYGFCERDDPRYLNAAHYALTPANPYFIPQVEGIWWHAHGRWSSGTFPGWITAQAASQDEPEMLRHLDRIRTLTDADGSFWWWPYPHADFQPEHPVRVNSKCGWAAGTYLTYFLQHILGITVDAAANQICIRPFSPWREFNWRRCRMGAMVFDVSYKESSESLTLELCNRNGARVHVTLEALVPRDAQPDVVRETGIIGSRPRYGRQSRVLRKVLEPGESAQLTLRYRKSPILSRAHG